MNNRISELVCQKIYDLDKGQDFVVESLGYLGMNFSSNYSHNRVLSSFRKSITDQYFQEQLSLISEFNDRKREKGSYYTQKDICEYIIKKSIILKYGKNKNIGEKYENNIVNFVQNLSNIDEILYESKFFDPTCGAGQFLIETFNIKLEILRAIKNEVSDDDIIKILNTIFGNDYDGTAIEICKIRLFFSSIKYIKEKENYELIAKIINTNLYNEDYIQSYYNIKGKYDFLIGNPPYVEYSKYEGCISNSYGNVYADVLENSMKHLKDGGILGFIIPISYISTPRMCKIRSKIEDFSKYEYIFSFADRPDCLFKGVHQKLNILIAQNGCENCKIFTSNYMYRYKNERDSLFNRIETIENNFKFDGYLAKIGNKVESSILNKIIYKHGENQYSNLLSGQSNCGRGLFLGMRACFRIKAFSFNPGSNEYKQFFYDDKLYYFVLCLLNSSLFWFYRISLSDCWHITQKELKNIKIPNNIRDTKIFELLFFELEKQLENTKEYVGTKQTEYEYKHKKCKGCIDKIDYEIGKVYGLSDEEIEYVKGFALNYR